MSMFAWFLNEPERPKWKKIALKVERAMRRRYRKGRIFCLYWDNQGNLKIKGNAKT